MYRILIVDDFEVDRETLKELLLSNNDREIEIAGECENGLQAMEFIDESKPDIIISDIEMPFMNGLELARNVISKYPEIKIIFCSLYDEFEYARKALYLNSYGYILKPIDRMELFRCLNNVIGDISNEVRFQKEYEELKVVLKLNKPVLIDNFLKSIIYMTIENEKDILDKAKYFELNLIMGYFRLIYIEIDDFELITTNQKVEQKQILSFKVHEKIKVITLIFGDYPVTRLDDSHFIAFFNDDNEDYIIEQSYKCAKNIISEFDMSDTSLSISLSPSSRNLSDLKSLFEQCKFLMKYKYTLGKGNVISGEDIPNSVGCTDIDINSIQKEIRFLVNSGSKDEIGCYIDKLFNNLPRNTGENNLKNLCFSIVMCLRFVLNESSDSLNTVFNDETLIWEKLLKFETIIDTRNWIKNILGFANEHVSSKSKSKNETIIKEVKKYIEKNYPKSIGLESISDELHYSPNYLNCIFKQVTGETITDYISGYKMEKAKGMLLDIRNKIYNISEALGYSHTAYFCNVFKKHTGLTPKEYRERFSL